MSREIKRVPLDFNWPKNEVWPGYTFSCEGCEHEEDLSCDECPRKHDPPTGDGYQIWETVSEGSPISPVFSTEKEIIEYLHSNGAGGIYKACTRAAAKNFIKTGWTPSMAFINGLCVDGIDLYSVGLHPALYSFDVLSDSIVDITKDEQIEESLDKFRSTLGNLVNIVEAVEKSEGSLPDDIKEALFNSCLCKLRSKLVPTQKGKINDC